MDKHQQFMLAALELARHGIGQVEPNPAVGCVIVRDNRIIGMGRHERFGGPHAEINALEDCRKKGQDPAGADVYVTLEPCCHHGKTGPCTEALIRANVGKIFVASQDPTQKVNGKGIDQLKHAGIPVETGLCRQETEDLNAPFYKHARTGLPWVIVKWAQSIDGKLARHNPGQEGKWISNPKSRRDVHHLRKKVQGILTGVQTVLMDNPRLTVRLNGTAPEHPPCRIVLDSQLRIPWDCHLITTLEAPTLIITTHPVFQAESEKAHKLMDAGIEVIGVHERQERCDLTEVLKILGSHPVQQLLIEAGPTLIGRFLQNQLADEVRIYIAPLLLGAAGGMDMQTATAGISDLALRSVQIQEFDGDVCIRGLL